MKIALVQMQMKPTLKENTDQCLKYIKEAAKKNANLVCFPELQLSPFFPQYPGINAEKFLVSQEDTIIKKFQQISAKYNIAIIPNFYYEESGINYNVSPMIDTTGEILGFSKMVHIVQYKQFFEQDYYTPSDTGFIVHDTSLGKIGIVICFDRHLPESIRTCAWQGASLVVIPAAITTKDNLALFDWEVRVESLHNSVFIAMCNRVGKEDSMKFSGGSIVTNPKGNLVAKADNQQQILYASIDLNESARVRDEKQYFKLLRPEVYLPKPKK